MWNVRWPCDLLLQALLRRGGSPGSVSSSSTSREAQQHWSGGEVPRYVKWR